MMKLAMKIPSLKRLAGIGLVLLTIFLGTAGAGLTIYGTGALTFIAGVLCHLLAVLPALSAARLRRGEPLALAERDAMLFTALLLPFMGPPLAIGLVRKSRSEGVENSHQVMERYKDHVKPRIPEYERSLFTGEFDRDLARKLDLESYRDVLRHGGTDQKRSALFRLAELGQPHHLALIRNCLEDDDQEVRLYAYGELDRLVRGHEDRVARGRAGAREAPGDAIAHLELAGAHFDLASSGVLDQATARFHLRAAARSAKDTRKIDPKSIEGATLEALSHAKIDEFEQAYECLRSLPEEIRTMTVIHLTTAEIAFVERDFPQAREEAEHLALLGVELPGWLEALRDTDEDEEEPGEAQRGGENLGTGAES